MSSIGEDPKKLTISQLKTQLKKLGVQAPKDARKADYVRLYESSVEASRTQSARRATPRRAPVKSQTQRSEFSSDEEAEPASKVKQVDYNRYFVCYRPPSKYQLGPNLNCCVVCWLNCLKSELAEPESEIEKDDNN